MTPQSDASLAAPLGVRGDLAALVAAVPWYHTIELPGGVVTPGEYDHRPGLSKAMLPASLAGKRCLDVGTHDGFWAYQMEKRGAKEVVGIDLEDPDKYDWPQPAPALDADTREFLARRREAFWVAHRALGSSVQRRDMSAYAVTPDNIGLFDFAMIGTLLHHLRDPIGALMALRRVVQGELLVSGVFSVSETLLHPRRPRSELLDEGTNPFWEYPNLAGLRRQLRAAGWEVVSSGRPYLQRWGKGATRVSIDPRVKGWSKLPRQIVFRFGIPHISLICRPII